MLDAARRTSGAHVIVASSSSVYGANRTLPASEDVVTAAAQPLRGQQAGRRGLRPLVRAARSACRSTVFRFFNVFGPLQRADHAYAAVVPAFVSAALRRRARCRSTATALQTRDFTFVDSVVRHPGCDAPARSTTTHRAR